jgi:hypothetical protein
MNLSAHKIPEFVLPPKFQLKIFKQIYQLVRYRVMAIWNYRLFSGSTAPANFFNIV